jgi:glycosyltransferase involved in cell wall biosynthesis
MKPKTKRVLLFNPMDPLGEKVGGVEVFLANFVKFAPAHFEIRWIGAKLAGNDRLKVGQWTRLELKGRAVDFMPIVQLKDANHKSRMPLSLRFALRGMLAKVPGFDAAVFNAPEFALPFLRARGRKLLIYHNDIEKQIYARESEVLWSRIPRVYAAYERLVVPRMNHVFSVNRNTIRLLKAKFGVPIDFLPTWADPEVFSPVPAVDPAQFLARVGRPPSASCLKLLFVGRLQVQKNPLFALEAVKAFKAARPGVDVTLLMIGEGNELATVRSEILRHGLERNVYIVPYEPQANLRYFYSAADITVLTSHFEGMPRCLMESLACGTPFVSTDCGESRYIQDGQPIGTIVDGFDAEAFAREVAALAARLSSAGERADLSRRCVSRSRAFQPAAVLAAVYDQIEKSP